MEAKEYTAERHFYVWKTEQPNLKFHRESQKFSLKFMKWHFKLSATMNPRDEEVWDFCMVYDSEPRIKWNVSTYVQDKKGALELFCTTDYYHMYNDTYQDHKCPNILTKMDAIKLQMNKQKYLYNNKFTFVIILDELINSLIDVKRNTLGGPQEEIHNLQQLSLSMVDMFESQVYSDVEIKCGLNVFFAHRNVLTARSAVFAEMFQNDSSGVFTRKVYIKNVRCDIFEKFLIFLYSGEIEIETVTTAAELYELAKKYDVFLLKQRCFLFLTNNITDNSVIEILTFADKQQDNDLMNCIVDFMVTEETFIKSVDWMKFALENPKLAVKIHEIYEKKKANILVKFVPY